MNTLPKTKKSAVRRLFRSGKSNRESSRKLKIHPDTISRFRKKVESALDTKFLCRCGKASGHRGFCAYLLSKSTKRKALMKRLHIKQRLAKVRRLKADYDAVISHLLSLPDYVDGSRLGVPALMERRKELEKMHIKVPIHGGSVLLDPEDIEVAFMEEWRSMPSKPKPHVWIKNPKQLIFMHQMIVPYKMVRYADGNPFNLTRDNLLDFTKLWSQKMSLMNSIRGGDYNAKRGKLKREKNGNLNLRTIGSPCRRAFNVSRAVMLDGISYTIRTKVVIGGRKKRTFEEAKEIALQKREYLYSMSREEFVEEAKRRRNKPTIFDAISTWSAYQEKDFSEGEAMDMGLSIAGGMTPKNKKIRSRKFRPELSL